MVLSRMNSIDVSQDKFLGGRLLISQLKRGYRAGTDPVLLAASLSLKPEQTLLDLGCGVGTAFLCALARENSIKATGIELQKELSDLAINNSARNSFEVDIINCSVHHLSDNIGRKTFDHVILNPPFFYSNSGTLSKSRQKLVSKFIDEDELKSWLSVAMNRLKPNGEISLISRTDTLAVVLGVLEKKVGSIKILPISSFETEPSSRLIISGKLGAKGKLSLFFPLIMHRKVVDKTGKNFFTSEAEGILYNGHSIAF